MNEKVNKEIIYLAGPNIISNISVPLLSTVDTILMGNLSSLHLAAVGIGSMLFNIIYWNFGFLRMGTTGITAQYYGGKDDANVWLSFLRAAMLACFISFALIIFQNSLLNIGTWSLNVSDASEGLVAAYFNIRIWAAPASLLLMVVMGWFFGVQNAIYPLILTLIINFVNIVLSYYLVEVQGMGVHGVAWGTVVAQYIGLLFGIIFIYYKYNTYINNKVLSQLREWSAYGRFMKINLDLFIRTVCLTFAFGFFYSQSSKISDTILAVNVVLMQYVNWMSYGIDGFAFACESLIGKYKGAKNELLSLAVVRQSFWWGGGVGLLYGLVYFIFGQQLFTVFSDDLLLYEAAESLLYYMALFPIVAFASYIWDGIFIGLTATSSMRNTMLMALICFLFSFYILPVRSDGSHIWISLIVFVIMRAVFQYLYYKKYGLSLK
ncbi:MAG: MATE family efflux transporter [Saprospiraceae bacterium]